MPPVENLLPFFAAMVVFAFTPGQSMVYMAVQTMAQGRRAGWMSAAGFHLAAYAHILAAAFGVAALLEVQPLAFLALKLAGAAYLIWMGARMMLDAGARAPAPTHTRSARRAFGDSVMIELFNPKTALFFFAFLPQFANPEAAAPLWAQIIALGVCSNVMFTVADGFCIQFSERLARWAVASPGSARTGARVGGGVFVALGLHIALREG